MVALSRLVAPTPAELRSNLLTRCKQLTAQMADLDPTGAAYKATDMRRDEVFDALFKLGPADPWGDPD